MAVFHSVKLTDRNLSETNSPALARFQQALCKYLLDVILGGAVKHEWDPGGWPILLATSVGKLTTCRCVCRDEWSIESLVYRKRLCEVIIAD
jgi:hypothetical protein